MPCQSSWPSAFDRFRAEYNEQRPHEALGQQTPSSVYTPSPPAYPARVREPEYGSALQVRRVGPRGVFSWKHQNVFVSETLIGERIGLLPVDERFFLLYFAAFPIARFDSQKRAVLPLGPAANFNLGIAGEEEGPPSPAPHPLEAEEKVSGMCPV